MFVSVLLGLSMNPAHQWTIYKEFRFEAAHRLPYHQGKCCRLHGHSWVGRVYITRDHLDETGPKQAWSWILKILVTILTPWWTIS